MSTYDITQLCMKDGGRVPGTSRDPLPVVTTCYEDYRKRAAASCVWVVPRGRCSPVNIQMICIEPGTTGKTTWRHISLESKTEEQGSCVGGAQNHKVNHDEWLLKSWSTNEAKLSSVFGFTLEQLRRDRLIMIERAKGRGEPTWIWRSAVVNFCRV